MSGPAQPTKRHRPFRPLIARRERSCLDCGQAFVKPGDRAPGGRQVRCRPCQRLYEGSPATKSQYAAQSAVKRALRDVFLRPPYCQRCAVDCKPEGHHFAGYDGPNALKVIWLCRKCHALAHIEMRRAAKESA